MLILPATLLSAGLAIGFIIWVDHRLSHERGAATRFSHYGIMVLLSALSGTAAWIYNGDALTSASTAVAISALYVSVSTDLRFGVLADSTSLIIAIAGMVGAHRLTPSLSWQDMAMGAAFASGILGLAGLYGLIKRKTMGLGTGDLGLAAALGLWCNPVTAGMAVGIGASATLVFALFKGVQSETRLPFAPGLAFGFLLMIGVSLWR